MSYYRNLIPGQWQVGDIVMGRGTNIRMTSIDVKPYDIQQQDYQQARADVKQFGNDQHTPTTIEMTVQVLNNKLLPGYQHLIPNFWHSQPTVSDLQREWRFDEGRHIWGQMKPLFHRSRLDDRHKVIFGRPGQFTYTFDDTFGSGEVVNCLMEFRRGDTMSYSVGEKFTILDQSHPSAVINGTGGDAPSWMRLLIRGPANHPVVTLENMYKQDEPVIIDFDYNIPAGMVVEISGYPWSKRVVNNAPQPLSMGEYLIGDSPYLDRLQFDFNAVVQASVAAGNTSSETAISILWRESYQVI